MADVSLYVETQNISNVANSTNTTNVVINPPADIFSEILKYCKAGTYHWEDEDTLVYTHTDTCNRIELGMGDVKIALLVKLILETLDHKVDIHKAKDIFLQKYNLKSLLNKYDSNVLLQNEFIKCFNDYKNDSILLYVNNYEGIIKYMILFNIKRKKFSYSDYNYYTDSTNYLFDAESTTDYTGNKFELPSFLNEPILNFYRTRVAYLL